MKNIFLSLFLLVAGMAIADDNAPVGSRSMSDEVLKELNAAKESEEAQGPVSDVNTEEAAGCFDCDYSPVYPNSTHWIETLSLFGESVGIEDGSIWQVNCSDRNLVQDWVLSDPVIITQNRSWFSSCKYRILNKNDGSSIPANLAYGPIIGGEYSLQISNIDHYNGLLILSDNSHWKISSRDRYLFPEWTLGDYILLGVNSGWDSSCPYILINSNMDNFIRAKQY